ncbi:MAG: CRISPR-associated protein Cas5 [Hydrogenibacillus schlegelii]|nr:CRISPR-associated protein Cas5 [Hydrogenibacillus schlegelii]
MERALRLTLRAPLASFRRPLDINYQRTFPLPPPTTVFGLIGAALGLSEHDLWRPDGPASALKIAVWSEERPGRGEDLWTLLKLNKGKMQRSPYMREILVDVRYTVVIGEAEAAASRPGSGWLGRLAKAFHDPMYPLSLGREDELAEVEAITFETVETGEPRFHGTVLPFDVRQFRLRPLLGSGERLVPPIVERVPLRFSVDKRGVRKPDHLTVMSFLAHGVAVEIPLASARRCCGRNFVWMTGE